MRVYEDGPDIDEDELRWFWMQPKTTVAVAGLAGLEDARKDLGNWADRGLIEFRKEGAGKTSPRTYSLATAIQFACMYRLTHQGKDVKSAKKIADHILKDFEKLIEDKVDIHTLEDDPRVFIYWFDYKRK